jgi:hypothetical protein
VKYHQRLEGLGCQGIAAQLTPASGANAENPSEKVTALDYPTLRIGALFASRSSAFSNSLGCTSSNFT